MLLAVCAASAACHNDSTPAAAAASSTTVTAAAADSAWLDALTGRDPSTAASVLDAEFEWTEP